MKCKLILRTSLVHCEHHHQFSWQSVCFSHAYQRVSTHTFLPAFTFYKIRSRSRCLGSGKKKNGQKFQMNGQKTVCFSHAYQRLSTHYFLPAFTFYPIYDFQNRFKHWPSTNNWLIFTDNFEVINYQPDPRSSVGGVGTGASMCRIMLRTAPKTEQLDYKLDLRTNLAKFYTGARSTQYL